MDGLTIATSVIGLLAWPATVLLALLMFKKSIENLLSALVSVKWKELEIGFDKSVEAVTRDAERVLPQAPAPIEIKTSDTVSIGMDEEVSVRTKEQVSPESRAQDRFLQLVDVHPAAAILESWLDLETELRLAAKKHGLAESHRLPTSLIGKKLLDQNIWDKEIFNIFSKLRDLRNTVVHTRAGSITPAQALEYDLVIRRLIAKLRKP